MKVDNFALTMHQACPAKYDLRMNDGWTVRARSAALGFGLAIHAGLAEWYRGHGKEAGIQAIHEVWDPSIPSEDFRTLQKCVSVFTEYTKEYPYESFQVLGLPDNPMVERTFTFETGMYLPCQLSFIPTDGGADLEPERRYCQSPQAINEPTCGCGRAKEPIEYGGIFDTLVESTGHVYILEHKSTSVLGSTYFNQFKPNNQVSGYVWGASLLAGRDVAGTMINAIGVYKAGDTRFQRSITSRNKFELEEWKLNVYATCVEIATHRLANHWPQRTQACTMYGTCEFHNVHTINDPSHRQKRLDQDYIRQGWNFEERDG